MLQSSASHCHYGNERGHCSPHPLGMVKCNFSSKVRSLCVKAGWGQGSLSDVWLSSLQYFSFFVFNLEKASKDKC